MNFSKIRPLFLIVFCSQFLLNVAWSAPQAGISEQKIVFIRHGEKPDLGLGMINCQGLNRALALPAVMLAKFGRPDFIFAADPHDQKNDNGQPYNYVRPLLTIAPTAIQFGLPINASFGLDNIDGLERELADTRYQNALVFVAWEHNELQKLVKSMLTHAGGQSAAVPDWKGSDFDRIYVLTLRRSQGEVNATFAIDHENLAGQSDTCPGQVRAVP